MALHEADKDMATAVAAEDWVGRDAAMIRKDVWRAAITYGQLLEKIQAAVTKHGKAAVVAKLGADGQAVVDYIQGAHSFHNANLPKDNDGNEISKVLSCPLEQADLA